MGVRTPKYVAGSAQAIGTSAEVYGAAYNVAGYGQMTFEMVDAGSGGDVTVKFYGKLAPTSAAPADATGLAQIGSDVTLTDGATQVHTISGAYTWIIATMAHASSEKNTTMNMQANPESGAGEW